MDDLANFHAWLIGQAYHAAVNAEAHHSTLSKIAIASPFIIEGLLALFVISVQCLGLLELKRVLFGPGVITRAMQLTGKVMARYESQEFNLPDGRRVKPKFDEETGEQKALEFVRPKPPPLPHQRPLKVKSGSKTIREIPFEHYQGE